MALKDVWVDRKNDEDFVQADDINKVAHAVMNLEDEPKLPKAAEADEGKTLSFESGAWKAVFTGLTTKQDDKGNNLLFLTQDGKPIGEGIIIPSGGGGGGGSNNAVMTMTNKTGWLSKTISAGAECIVSFSWSSIEDGFSTGNGALFVSVGGAVKASYEIEQGDIFVDLTKYLSIGSNRVLVEVVDSYGNSKTLGFSISVIALSISSYFDGTAAYTGDIAFGYTPVGAVDKTVYFIVDGAEVGKQMVSVSGREISYTIPAQKHGSHTFEVYFTADIDGQPVESNHLFYDLITYESGNNAPIVSVPFKISSVKQYSAVAIPYIVYTPDVITSAIELRDGTNTVKTLTVDRTQQIWSYKALNAGTANLSIVCGDTTKPISFTVTPNELDVYAETANLELYLTSAGRNNNEETPLDWSSGAVKAELTGFNLTSDGWKLDEDNNTVLRVAGDARVYIPFNIFGSDFRTTGKTVEFEFATRDVLNYDAVILSAWSGDRGIQITAQKALLKSEQSEIFTQYKENETVRIAFTIEKKAENRLLAIYINGIMSGVVQYPADDDFSQTTPVGISIGSNDCTTDIYCIRVYSNNLTRYQILDNWIADTQDIEKLIERYNRNNIFDAYGNIVTSKIPSYLPYMVLNVSNYSDLPQSKGDKKTVGGYYVDPLNPERSFTFAGAEIDVQGTSSQYYSRKNYKTKFKNGFVIGGKASENYQLRNTSMPTDTFTYKADVASSEGANNVELARLYDDTCPVKTPPQIEDSRVRQGIEGYPILMFYGEGNNLTFLGKYNFNNDKGTEEVFGFKSGDESWEILQNNTEMVIWKDDDFSGDAWKTSFEGRYPDKNTDTTNLAAFASWLKSTDTTAVTSEEEKAARLEKFKTEFADWCNVDAMLFNYIFTEMFLMVDNRAKNAFPTRYSADGKWLILPYDYDTAIGINNEGELKFGYELEDTDLVNGNNVYNGQDSVLYVNMRLAFADEIMAMYKELRTGDVFSYEEIEKRFEEHQSKWGEAVFNEDAFFKYIDPLVNEGNKTYLPMLQGSKAEQRKWWLYNRFRYLDSKYNAGDALEDYILMRSYAVADIEVTPYADIYASAKFDSALVQKRALRGSTYTLENPLSGGRDAVISVYSASQLSSIGDLSGLKVGMADFSKAVKLSSLKVGDGALTYDNPNLTDLTIGNLVLLRTLDVRNCSALTQAVDISGCTNIENVYFDGTATTGITLPNGGILKVLRLPSTVTNLTILNQKNLTEFVLPNYANVSTLRIENTPVIDTLSAINAIQANSRVRLVGVNWTMNSASEILALMDKLDTFRGLDENGNNLDKAVVSGVIHINALTADELAEMNARYPNIKIDYKSLTVIVRFYNGETLWSEQRVAEGATIVAPDEPTKESTAQYEYTFKGWSIDGENVVELGVAGKEGANYYALFNEVLRYYTVRFINGTTVLQTVSAPYGGNAVYTGDTPVSSEDASFAFEGWRPSPTNITGDLDCYAQFENPLEVAEITDDWETILASTSDGTYRTKYKVGNYKPLDLGSEGVVNMQIAAFEADELADGSGYAPISWVSKELLKTNKRMNPSLIINYYYPSQPSWYMPNATQWAPRNNYVLDEAKAKFTITCNEAGTFEVRYKGNSQAKLYLEVNGAVVESEDNSNTQKTYSIEVAQGDTVIVNAISTPTAEGSQGSTGVYFYLNNGSYGKYTLETEIENCTSREAESYEEGTGGIGGWELSEMRAYYKNTLKPLIPELVRNSIKEVVKYNYYYTTAGTKEETSSTEDVWMPSNREIAGSTAYGKSGVAYTLLFPDTASRIKKRTTASSGEWWWLRSAYVDSYFCNIAVGGQATGNHANQSGGVALGFCT